MEGRQEGNAAAKVVGQVGLDHLLSCPQILVTLGVAGARRLNHVGEGAAARDPDTAWAPIVVWVREPAPDCISNSANQVSPNRSLGPRPALDRISGSYFGSGAGPGSYLRITLLPAFFI